MKRFGLGLLATTMLSGTAMAADLPVFVEEQPYVIEEPAPVYNWTGVYVGLQGGYAWGDSQFDYENEFDSDLGPDFDEEFGFSNSTDISGFVGGAHIGALYQFNRFVIGAEGDIEFSGIDGDDDDFFEDDDEEFDDLNVQREVEYNWLASARLRAGLSFNRFLVYATGGYAYADVEDRAWSEFDGDDEFFDDDDDGFDESEGLHGYTVGGGVEALLGTNMSVGLEYRYTDLEDTSYEQSGVAFDDFGDPGIESERIDLENDFHAVRARLSYHF